MAKVSGPLFSMDARGAFGGALVFSGWKGRATVRQLVIPANPHIAAQEFARNKMRVTASAQKFANVETLLTTHIGIYAGLTDKAALRLAAPSGQAWNGTLVKSMIGTQGLAYTAAGDAWTAIAANHAAWETAAATTLDNVFVEVAQTIAGGGAGTPITPGEVFFRYCYALFTLGISTEPGAVPPVYA